MRPFLFYREQKYLINKELIKKIIDIEYLIIIKNYAKILLKN